MNVRKLYFGNRSVMDYGNYPPFRNCYAINLSKITSRNDYANFAIQPEVILQKYLGAMTTWPLRKSIPGSMLQEQ